MKELGKGLEAVKGMSKTAIHAVKVGVGTAMHAIKGGVMSSLNGGNFLSGALSAGLSHGLSGQIDGIGNEFFEYVAAGAVGAVASIAGGGNFRDGFFTGAMTYAVNHERHKEKEGIPITDEEQKWSDEGNRRAYWTSRAARGDPMGKIALDILDGRNPGGLLAQRLLSLGIRTNSLHISLNDVGVALMRAHTEMVKFDMVENPGNTRGVLNTEQVDYYHNQVWDKLGLPSWSYGGNWAPRNLYYPYGDDL